MAAAASIRLLVVSGSSIPGGWRSCPVTELEDSGVPAGSADCLGMSCPCIC